MKKGQCGGHLESRQDVPLRQTLTGQSNRGSCSNKNVHLLNHGVKCSSPVFSPGQWNKPSETVSMPCVEAALVLFLDLVLCGVKELLENFHCNKFSWDLPFTHFTNSECPLRVRHCSRHQHDEWPSTQSQSWYNLSRSTLTPPATSRWQ